MKISLTLLGCLFGLAACQVAQPVRDSEVSDEKRAGYQQLVAHIQQACDFTNSDECEMVLNEELMEKLGDNGAQGIHLVSTGNTETPHERRACMEIQFSHNSFCTNPYKKGDLCDDGRAWESNYDQSLKIINYSHQDYTFFLAHGAVSEGIIVMRRFEACIPLAEGDFIYWL